MNELNSHSIEDRHVSSFWGGLRNAATSFGGSGEVPYGHFVCFATLIWGIGFSGSLQKRLGGFPNLKTKFQIVSARQNRIGKV